MSVIERYRASTYGTVLNDATKPPSLAARCSSVQMAERIADALNNHRGAVEALRAAHVQVQAAMSPTGPRTAGPLLNAESILGHALRTVGGQS
jgi:hypothetical protein